MYPKHVSGNYHSLRGGYYTGTRKNIYQDPIDPLDLAGAPAVAAPKQPANTVTIPCHHIRMGDLLMLQGRPCQVIRITTSAATGQHRYLGVDLFTRQLNEESSFIANPSPSVVVQTMLGPVFKQYRVLDLQDHSGKFQHHLIPTRLSFTNKNQLSPWPRPEMSSKPFPFWTNPTSGPALRRLSRVDVVASASWSLPMEVVRSPSTWRPSTDPVCRFPVPSHHTGVLDNNTGLSHRMESSFYFMISLHFRRGRENLKRMTG